MKFFKTFLAALLAFVVANILIGIISMMIFAGIAGGFAAKEVTVTSNSVLKIDFATSITDAPQSTNFNFTLTGFSYGKSNTLLDVLNAVDNAATDSNIKGILIDMSAPTGSISAANMEELRAAIENFKKSGKFVIAYGEYFGQLGYYFASVADKVYLNPVGGMDWRGLASQVMFYKGALDKLGVKAEIFRHGSFKSAVEPYMLDKMSPENREQLEVYLRTMWGTIVGDISRSRGIDSLTLVNYATNLSIDSPESAEKLGLVDGLLYQDQLTALLKRMVAADGGDIDTELAEALKAVPADSTAVASDKHKDADRAKYISLGDYTRHFKTTMYSRSKNRIAIIYIDGNIVDGKGERGDAGSATISKQIAKAREDDRVKAVVLRVASPGGSAQAADIMWRELSLLREKKPLVVSMGDYAASGGYYVSCPGDVILADRMTLTGSIGVFGLMFNMGDALKDKLGITVDVAKITPHGDMGSSFRPWDEAERAYMMRSIEQIYSTFIGHVAEGRNMTTEAVDKIGGGRIWSGVSASQIGLVDGFGGIQQAISLAADRAGIAGDYRVVEITEPADEFSAMLDMMTGGARIDSELGEAAKYYNKIRSLLSTQGVQAALPYDIEIR
jgi:protease-4